MFGTKLRLAGREQHPDGMPGIHQNTVRLIPGRSLSHCGRRRGRWGPLKGQQGERERGLHFCV